MALFFIGGTAGTGKSEVCRVLRERGYEAHDSDDGLARWQHNQTGFVYPPASIEARHRTPEFFAQHSWNIPRQAVESLAQEAAGRVVFIAGSLSNEDELHDLFTKVFALYVDEDLLKHRLATRTTNDWGKQPHELQRALALHHSIYTKHEAQGDVIVDSARPLDVVADDILSQATVYAAGR